MENNTINIEGRSYTVGYARKRHNGDWSLGVKGNRGAIYMVDYFSKTGTYSKMVRV